MKKNKYLLITVLAVLALLGACKKDFLDIKPKGSLDEGVLATEKGVNALLIGAYSMLDGISSQFGWEAASSNWVYGDIRGMIGNKGTDSGDQPDINPLQSFNEASTNPYLNVKWRAVYESISRCNSAITVAGKALAAGTITADQADSFIKQARALRGWYHFEAWRMWVKVPYIDEKTDQTKVDNSADIRDKIIADLSEGVTLPNNMGQIGRFNGTVCNVLLAKAKMQMNGDYAGALVNLNIAKGGTKPNGQPIGLAPTYGEIFDIANRNAVEAVYTVQYSVNDGSGAYNAGWGEVLNFPYKGGGGSPGGCCGFFQATQEFVNSFTTSGGLPLLDYTYNNNADLRDEKVPGGDVWAATNKDGTPKKYAKNAGVTVYDPAAPNKDLGYKSLIDDNAGNNPLTSPAAWQLVWTEDNSRPVDPRLDWTVGRRGIPYWDWGVHTGSDWIRDQSYAGPYSPKKQVYKKSQEGQYTEVGNWTSGWTANGYRMIRYADILLLIAECQIETGDLAGARANINLVRARAANPAGFVYEKDGTTPAANYVISQYPAAGYPFDNKANAQLALRMERKLELGMEGHRWFDLNRWGITVAELTRVLTYEKTMPWGNSMYGTATIGAEDATFPIPQRQIDLSLGKIVQNTGH
jgi:starch-binding outer membrane protein, SusD/RagB family